MTVALPGATWRVTPIHLDTVHYPDWHPRSGEDGPVYIYVLRNGEQTFLVDTGIGPQHALIDRLYEPKRGDPLTELARVGVTPADLDGIIVSHLHFDHGGGLLHFPGIPIYVQRTEWEAAQQPKYTIPEFLDLPDANWKLLEGDTDLAPGLGVFATPGHTPGHQSVAASVLVGSVIGVDGAERSLGGLAILAGQSVETAGELKSMLDSGELTAGARRILELDPWRVYFSHASAIWQREAD